MYIRSLFTIKGIATALRHMLIVIPFKISTLFDKDGESIPVESL